jgi:hypothetical protein
MLLPVKMSTPPLEHILGWLQRVSLRFLLLLLVLEVLAQTLAHRHTLLAAVAVVESFDIKTILP